MIYLLIFLVLLFCIYYFDYAKHSHLFSFTYWGVFVVLVLVAGLRYRIGNDSIVYENDYEAFPKIWELFSYNFSSTRYEPGFIVFSSIPRSFSSDFTWLQFFEAAVVNFVIFWFILKNTSNRFFCLTLYFVVLYLYFTTEIMREAIAVSIFLLSWPFFRDGKWLKYYLLAALATFFHTSAFFLLVLPIFWLPGVRYFFRFGYRTIFVCIGIFAVAMVIQLKFYDYVQMLALTQRMADRAHIYAKSELGGKLLNFWGMGDTFLRYALYAVLALWLYKSKNKARHIEGKDKMRAEKMEFMVLWQVYVTIIGMVLFIALRYTNYFSMFAFILMSQAYLKPIDIKDKVYRLRPMYWNLVFLPFFLASFNFYLRPVNKAKTLPYYTKYYPYKHRLDPEKDSQREAIFRYYGTR
ncbi:MAG: EpsG family protein [Muribaculaceae bacterium]|nr:EpsG family protein [Muribaculaceae bacterium]